MASSVPTPPASPAPSTRREGGKRPAADRFAVVGVGASAGGLEACIKLLDAMPAETGMAFLLVQHLDPHHQSMLAELLAPHTRLSVREAVQGMAIEREHLYVIPPGAYLGVRAGLLQVSPPTAPHGARLPFDHLLHAIAGEYGPRAACVVLSGTGADGSLGLRSVHEKGGLVIAQDPAEAAFDGMPNSAIATGQVDQVLAAADIPAALLNFVAQTPALTDSTAASIPDEAAERLAAVLNLLHTEAGHDFSQYKSGTLQRRIGRRMAMAGLSPNQAQDYLDLLRRNENEREQLVKDMLINVTSFFRDRPVFDRLAAETIPDLVTRQPPDQPLRIWVLGCSTGEEAYSIAILFQEAIAALNPALKLQVFASDADSDAVAAAREGLYPETIAAEVSPERLARFFSPEARGYRVAPSLRAAIVFTVQDVLVDPPFSRLDMISCRNLLIYLSQEAQAKVIALLHFALRQNGVLLLGASENAAAIEGRFEVLGKAERIYRHIGRPRTGGAGPAFDAADVRTPLRRDQPRARSREDFYGDVCRRIVLEAHAPAAVLINRSYQRLYALGPVDRYLSVAPGGPSQDILAMVGAGLRMRLRGAMHETNAGNPLTVISGNRIKRSGVARAFRIEVRSVLAGGEDLLLISFVEEAEAPAGEAAPSAADEPRVALLERELEDTRAELQGAIRSLEASNEEQKAINEEALSVNEEAQSTNEELLTSKEELQSLNEELAALNAQLQETLERQRATSDDLRNVLYSTDVATLFLDRQLNIRFFTPATSAVFHFITSDIGRPLADLHALAADATLLADAAIVLHTSTPIEHEVEGENGAWFLRRILPYRAHDGATEGVVITFVDITERRRAAAEVQDARRRADLANAAKSRFLAAASHDLRQPLQSLSLLQTLLGKAVQGERAENLVARMEQTLGAMSGMLNTLLDINQIEAGVVHPERTGFVIGDLLARLSAEFAYHAAAKGLLLRTVPCALQVRSDPRLLEQMLRNLISNALKYTARGKVLMGCRRRGSELSIEIWDSGAGIEEAHFQSIFEEYYQVDNPARESGRGLGLGLSIVRRLSTLLDHPVRVRSCVGRGSVFAVDVPRVSDEPQPPRPNIAPSPPLGPPARTGSILVVEDDTDLRDLLELALHSEGYRVATAPDGVTALRGVIEGAAFPDLVLADFNLPNGLNGPEFAARFRTRLARQIPVIILSGDVATATMRDIALDDCVQLSKPVKLDALAETIRDLLGAAPPALAEPLAHKPGRARKTLVHVIDDDSHVRESIRSVFESAGRQVKTYAAAEAFLEAYQSGEDACLVVDAVLPGMSGISLLRRLREAGDPLPAIMITGASEVGLAVRAMKAGADDFVEKPIRAVDLLDGVERALERSRDLDKAAAWRRQSAIQIASLTPREREILDLVLDGHPSKNIAAKLAISQRTVENHRASIMTKTGAKSVPALVRITLAAIGETGP